MAFTAAIVLTLFTNCNNNTDQTQTTHYGDSIHSIAERGELVVAMDVETPGFFVFGGESYGYQYDLLKAYADHLGVNLRVISGKSPATCANMIRNGEADMVTTIRENLSKEEEKFSVDLYNTSYVLLGSKKKAAQALKDADFSLTSFLREGKLLVSSAFQNTKAYKSLIDSLAGRAVYVSSGTSIELIEQLSSGEFDFVICETGEAHIGIALSKNVEQIYSFSEEVSLCAAISPRITDGKKNFEEWLSHYRDGAEYAMLNYLYFEKGIVGQFTGKYTASGKTSGISVYDKLFQQICKDEGYDWRLVAAIAYNESRFKPDVVSRCGAKGLMQVMPAVARQFDVKGDIMNPENNVLLGVKILGKIEKSLKFDSSTPHDERMPIILACYNAGIGHVMDARNLAEKYGADPDSWDDVSQYLRLKSEPSYANDNVVKYGRFNGRETTAFVKGVIDRYETYCSNIAL